ncbi:Phosphatidylinositol-binding clathrin assembly protein LAP [Fasciola hepatica]|uniref:Phosphatidylinositol-binding clathrin assembly protein LAP n=1 Tax=Fasciola hepatica TaxID=6192 RepID=A0A4E0RSJ3_FASHE|nr:Phosphatidylinositol-binding clathrin assembly protein LAP [Fasciola hepatica]
MQAHGIGPFIKLYAKYLDGKTLSYRQAAYDLCRVKLWKEEGSIRNMSQSKLGKTLPVVGEQLDALLTSDATYNKLASEVLQVLHPLLYRDPIRLYAACNETMISSIGRYFPCPNEDIVHHWSRTNHLSEAQNL